MLEVALQLLHIVVCRGYCYCLCRNSIWNIMWSCSVIVNWR